MASSPGSQRVRPAALERRFRSGIDFACPKLVTKFPSISYLRIARGVLISRESEALGLQDRPWAHTHN
jgi:hypothetical protein